MSVRGELPRQVGESLESLTSQVALALESAALTEDLLIQQSQARFASLVKNSSDLVMVIEADTKIKYASPSASRVLGRDAEELEGSRFSDLIAQEDRATAMSFLTAMSEDEGLTGLEKFRVVHRDGSVRTVETLRTNLMHDPNVRGIVLNTRDITERKQFEEQLEHQALHDAADRPGEPRAVPRPRAARARPAAARRPPGLRPVHGPRRLQDDQRLARPRGGRSAPARHRRAPAGQPADGATRPRVWAGTSSRSCSKTAAKRA